MVEVTQQEPYLEQLEEVIDSKLKTSLKSLYDAGYVDFDENKIMIESNPGMSLDDIMACIDESKREYEGTELVDLEGEQSSSSVAAGELDTEDIEEMNKLVGPILETPTESDPEIEEQVQVAVGEEEATKEEEKVQELYGQ